MAPSSLGQYGMTASQAWSILTRHAREEIEPLRLQELCRDNDRVSSLVAVYNTTSESTSTTTARPMEKESRILIADLSRQRMTLDTLNHLLKLATARHLKKFITQLAWGQNNPAHPVLPKRLINSKSGTQKYNATDSPTSHKMTRFLELETPQPSRNVVEALQQQQFETMPTMHLALRAPAKKGYEMFSQDGTNVLIEIHREWDRLQRLSDCIRRGQLRGVTGSMIRDVVVIGRGVPVAALKFIYAALLRDERAVLASRMGLVEPATSRIRRNFVGAGNAPVSARRLFFLATVDPVAASEIVADLDAASTLVISIALNGNEETGLATRTLKSWLLQSLGSNRRADHVLAKHMVLVTGNDRIASVINKPESVHMIPAHSRCEAFTTFSAAGLLPLSIVFGWDIVKELLDGAHDMDVHFVETNPRHNIPVLLALVDVWNDAFLGATSRIVTPCTEALEKFPAFVGAIESQTCGKSPERNATPSKLQCSATVVDAGLDSANDRAFYQSGKVLNMEMVMTMDCQLAFNSSRTLGVSEDAPSNQDALMCAMFAHADELAFGYRSPNDPLLQSSVGTVMSLVENDISEGNRPSLLLITGKLDAFACGQLVALSEHRAVVKAHLWGLDPFTKEVGSSFHMYRADKLKEELQDLVHHGANDEKDVGDGDGTSFLSTRTILLHYASSVRDQQHSVQDS